MQLLNERFSNIKIRVKVLYKTNSHIFVRVFQVKSITTIYSKVRKQ